ncbi:hypothetical protein COEREDRAFT_87488 [Coemansia reversa NRRL 1564]|uniref:Uncharacterized protein n=1 Tax=Coemansia reversa (strain ATCC 12441 / NRRL 1564) TaxID=763665 RepID=A0A2G5BAF6_COERN|nr:hypothetical protein COEREDRAFT_87485 [Coemansia reversa NRRL 1564]PIA16003.1 hypothetical protein COEREDRAFT_87488 [Coemansia reversa NRRL 1564]|eukprot:PIA15998.1 hypothetical protein COEREDRAFT_87485 [Coemansia reversa NRRL 1564]
MSKSQILRQTVTETAMHIRRHIGMVTPRFVRHMMNFMASETSMQHLIAMFQPDKAFFSASIVSGFPMFGMSNFGFGRPAHIDIPAYLTPGFSIWLPTHKAEQPIHVNLALTYDIVALIEKDTEFRQFVDIMS